MSDDINILVTGAGSTVGQGIIKSLRHSKVKTTIVSSDISPLSAGLLRTDSAIQLPKFEDADALEALTDAIIENQIDLLLIGSEYDLKFLSENRSIVEQETGVRILVSPLEVIQLADDKWETTCFLRDNGLPYAEAAVPKCLDEALELARNFSFPVMLKDRFGTSSRNVHLATSNAELAFHFDNIDAPMVQKVITVPDKTLDKEYTCSTFTTSGGDIIGPFVAQRYLRGGDSWAIKVASDNTIYEMMRTLTAKLPCLGSLNVQLFLTESGPIPFEINARFSGTTAIRAHFGFNEPEFAVRDLCLSEDIPEPAIGQGIALRYIEEVFIDGPGDIKENGTYGTGTVHPWF